MLLTGYTVLKTDDKEDPIPFKIVRVQVAYGDPIPGSSLRKATQFIEQIAGHSSRNIACYWVSRLNEGRCTEEYCQTEIAAYQK